MRSQPAKCSQTDRIIYIVGPWKLQNELIASRLEQETGAKCRLEEDIFHVPFPDHTKDDIKTESKLVLWDCRGEDLKSLLVAFESCSNQKLSRDHIVLFNVCHSLGIEEKCVWRGVRGFFYDDDSLALFLKGVRAVLNGQLWLSRQIMTKCIENNGWDNRSKTDNAVLTQRERELIAQVAVGATNNEIADRLCISPHTVKTHLYNIFKKLNVPNRLQAALWAAKNL